MQFILYNCEALDSVQLALINDHKKVQTVMYLFILSEVVVGSSILVNRY